MKTKVWLDTDIGSDIDDAICLAYLLSHPDCELAGISTVSGRPVARARLADALCHAAGRPDLPLYPGEAMPLKGEQRQPEAPQAAALGAWPHRRDFPAGQAVSALAETIRRHPGEVVLLGIGPMTNIGRLFSLHPDVAGLLRGLWLMCGWFRPGPTEPGVEWNARCDPEAAAIVYRTAVKEHRSFGIDVTRKVTLHAAGVRERFTAPILAPVRDFAEVWFQRAGRGVTFHDPLAAVALFEPSVCGMERGRVTVRAGESGTPGATAWEADPAGPHQVAVSVRPDAFFAHFFSVVSERRGAGRRGAGKR